jgi:penicillin-binding protein 1A
MLAGLFKAPSRFAPHVNLPAARARANVVLDNLVEAGFMTEGQVFGARRNPAMAVDRRDERSPNYYLDWAFDEMKKLVDTLPKSVHERVFVARLAIDLNLQNNAERAVEDSLRQYGREYHAKQAAAVLMETDGAVRAMVGGRSYSQSPYNRATEAIRQPGSAFKPFVYLTAFEHGRAPSDTMNDVPINIHGWRPDDYEGKYEGAISLTRAFAKSSNSIAAQLTNQLGPKTVARTAHRLGISSNLDINASLALGTSGVSPLELTTAYVPFANGGQGVIAFGIQRIKTASGKVLWERKNSGPITVMTPANAAAMTSLMVATVETGTGKAARLSDRPSAGKTGTTQDFHDAWFVGYSADLVCGVWIGNDDNTPMKHATGGGLPAHIFKSFMEGAEAGLPSKPLAGTEVPVAGDTTAPPDESSGDDFSKFLDSLFGKGDEH